ncbi:hypothetical protein HAHE_13150 [Haloferula helveola]|uniref:Protein kinase domain-containing protein n=1 Tax=Haloferula helveola TaxID=490095 RepID=A0ABM7RBF2_9BACT|nr:hypothetical protein HAHE_13150 [Haloferula helveola]
MAGGLCPHCLLSGLLESDPKPRLGEAAGDAVGPYELLQVIGEGGMGSVWRARQLHPVEREVALKIIRLGMDTREIVSRFEAERQSLAMMDHPGIARVYEAGATDSGRPYFAMELVEGETVTSYCASRRLVLDARLRLFLEICEAVEHAHRKGVLHRDIKPSNVLVVDSPEGPRPKVIDFGIAKTLESRGGDGRTFFTRSGHAIGTPGYMSPEQAGAEPDIDTRSDVYSLGALLYEMLTGTPPFGTETFREAANAEVMRLIRETDPPRPSRRAMTADPPPVRIAPDLDRVVMKALARERERRYGGATLLGEDIRRFLDHEPVSATDPTLSYRAGKFIRKHRVPVGFAAGIVAALAIGLWLAKREASKARQAAALEREARLEVVETLADSHRDAGLQQSRDRDDGLAALWFTLAAQTADHDPRRAAANRLRARLHQSRAPVPIRYLEQPVPPDPVLEFDAESAFLHERSATGPDAVFDLEAGRPVDFGFALSAAAWLPRGRIAVSDGERVEIRGLADRATLSSFSIPDGGTQLLAASADGRLLFVGGRTPRVWDVEERRFASGVLEHPAAVSFAALSPDGQRVLTVDTEDQLRVFKVREGTQQARFEPIAVDPMGAADRLQARFSDDSGIVWARTELAMCLIDADSGEVLQKHPGLNVVSDFAPDGEASVSFLGMSSKNGTFPGFFRQIGDAAFLPDESGLYAAGLGEILDLRGERRSRIGLPGAPWRISPDGTLLAVRHPTGIVIYQIARPGPLVFVGTTTAGAIAVNRDGSLFASAGWNSPHHGETSTRAFKVEDGQPAGPVIETGFQQLCGAFLPGSHDFVTGGRETPIPVSPFYTIDPERTSRGVLQRWDVRSGERVAGPLILPVEPQTLAVHPSEPWFAVLGSDGTIWRVESDLSAVRTLAAPALGKRPPPGLPLRGNLLFSADGETLYANGLDTRVRAFEVRGGQLRFVTPEGQSFGQRMHLTDGVLLSPTRSSADPWLFDAGSGAPIAVDPGLRPGGGFGARLTPGGDLLVPGRQRIEWIDWRQGLSLGHSRFDKEATTTYSMVVPDTPWVMSAIGSNLEPPSMRLWDSRTGLELGPRWDTALGFHSDYVPTPDGRHVIFCAKLARYIIVKLDELRAAAEHSGLSPEDEMLLAEIDAARRIVDGRPSPVLSSAEWGEMWKEFSRRHPGFRALRPDRESLLRWHRNRAAIHGPRHEGILWQDGAVEKWHRAQIERIEGED